MYANANAAYQESRVLSANPVELTRMLYEGASDAVRDARWHLAAGRIAERSRSINKACGILAELIGSLDRERGGAIAERLGQLYDYMYARLIEANRRQADAPLAEVLGLLTTLTEAWEAVGSTGGRGPAPRYPRPRIRLRGITEQRVTGWGSTGGAMGREMRGPSRSYQSRRRRRRTRRTPGVSRRRLERPPDGGAALRASEADIWRAKPARKRVRGLKRRPAAGRPYFFARPWAMMFARPKPPCWAMAKASCCSPRPVAQSSEESPSDCSHPAPAPFADCRTCSISKASNCCAA